MLPLHYITAMVYGLGGYVRHWRKAQARTDPQASARWLTARPPLDELLHGPEAQLPDFVRQSAVAMRFLRLLGQLKRSDFPESRLRHWTTRHPEPRAHFAATFLVKVIEQKRTMLDLRTYLVEHPALVWLLGFRLHADPNTTACGFDVERSLPTHRHFSRVMRELPNEALQFLPQSSVKLQQEALPADVNFGDEISLDTKHIIAWVKENNPKCYVEDRFDKTKQPAGDPDCKLGCKKKSNAHPTAENEAVPEPTLTCEGLPVSEGLPKPEKGDENETRKILADRSDEYVSQTNV